MKLNTKKPYFFNVKKEQKCTLIQLKTTILPPPKKQTQQSTFQQSNFLEKHFKIINSDRSLQKS